MHLIVVLLLFGQLSAAEHNIRSLEAYIRTELVFENRSGAPLLIYWADYKGSNILYRELEPGGTYTQPTYATHPWRVFDKRTHALIKTVVAGSKPQIIVIDKQRQLASTAQDISQKRQPQTMEVCAGERIYLKPGEEISIHITRRPGCSVSYVSIARGSAVGQLTFFSGRKKTHTWRAGEALPPDLFAGGISGAYFKANSESVIRFLGAPATPASQTTRPETNETSTELQPSTSEQSKRDAPKEPPRPTLSDRISAMSKAFMDFLSSLRAVFLNLLRVLLGVGVVAGLAYGLVWLAQRTSVLVISHWYHLIENLQASPKEFYASIEQAIASRQVPAANHARVDWQEGGLFSAYREYLRISREKHVLDVCGGPYGTGFFVSWWLGELRPSAIAPTLATITLVSVLYFFMTYNFGIVMGYMFTGIGCVVILLFVGILINQSSGEDWVRYVLVIPVLGWIFERLFLPPTYYRIDTALMFQQAVHKAVLEVIDQLTEAKGIRALSADDRKPILRDFFQRKI